MRLIQYLARAGVASRRKSEDIIRAGRVKVDGQPVDEPAFEVPDGARVFLDGEPLRLEEFEYYALHKPLGVISTAEDTHGRQTVLDLVDSKARLYPVGRLDADTTGLILLTNDGDLANALTHPSHEVPKIYVATVAGETDEPTLAKLRSGVELEDGVTAPAEVKLLTTSSGHSVIELTIHEGRNRQVRRMCEAVGHPVKALQRIAIGPIRLEGLAEGQYRALTDDELSALRSA